MILGMSIFGTVIIIGSTGMLGRELAAACRRRNTDVHTYAGRESLDITNQAAVRRVFGATKPRVVINAAGYTDVDRAEADPDAADQVNHLGLAILSQACRHIGALLVYYSTDYVFNGMSHRPYRIDDHPDPINAYGRSKLAGEQAVSDSGCEYLMLRTSWLFAPHGRNFVRTILALAGQRPTLDVVNDQRGRPTYAADLAQMTLDLVEHGARGTLHAANTGHCSWYEFARTMIEFAGLECDVRPSATSPVPRPARRPRFSVLDLSETIAVIGEPRHWKDALAECVEELTADRSTRP